MAPALLNQMSRFTGVGAVNTVLTLLLYQVFLLWMPFWLAYSLSFAAGIAVAAVAHSRFVFGLDLAPMGAIRFALFYVAAYGIGLALLSFLVRGVGMPASVAPFIVIPLMLPLNFFGSRLALGGARGSGDGSRESRR